MQEDREVLWRFGTSLMLCSADSLSMFCSRESSTADKTVTWIPGLSRDDIEQLSLVCTRCSEERFRQTHLLHRVVISSDHKLLATRSR